ncbi:MAG: DUF1614 domain-containing protein [Gammaproteobacteria bacterium]|nr:DUF1614 domain-containing protein [Gammaproteobacteria bacterium]
MQSRSSLFLILFLLAFVAIAVQLQALTIAFDKIGLSKESAFLLLLISLVGAGINLPLFTIKSEAPPAAPRPLSPWWNQYPKIEFTGKTLVAVNAGGCVIPVAFSIYLIWYKSLNPLEIIIVVASVTLISRLTSRSIPGLGIGMPMFVAPISAALTSTLTNAEQSAPLAYIAGTMGVLIGADILRLGSIRKLGTPLASIGGGGTFDGIFLSGLVAVLLA